MISAIFKRSGSTVNDRGSRFLRRISLNRIRITPSLSEGRLLPLQVATRYGHTYRTRR